MMPNSSGDSPRRLVKFATIIAKRSKQSDRNRASENAAETARIAGEEARIAAETARTAGEEARDAAHAAREAVVETVRATAEALNASLEQMQLVEDMRRTLREVRDHNKLDSN